MTRYGEKLSVEELRAAELKYLSEGRKLQLQAKALRIANFNGDFAFLNNEFASPVLHEGLTYPNVFAAYQGARVAQPELKRRLAESRDVYEVFELAKEERDPPDWASRRRGVMEQLVRDKFIRNP